MTRDVRHQARGERENRGNALTHGLREGVIVDVDVSNKLVRVELRPEGVQLPWMPCRPIALTLGAWTGYAMPANGTTVLLMAKDPDAKAYRYLGPIDDDQDLPAGNYAAGQVAFQHQNGNGLILDADGMVYIGSKAGSQALVQQSWITNTFNSHTHPHPMGPTSAPLLPWASGDVTTKSKGA
jgi:phage baseplate assembly protein gpV